MLSDPALLLSYLFTSFVIVVVPGPTVTVIVANSLRAGASAGLLNVAGTQAGLMLMILLVAMGMQALSVWMVALLFWIKLAGAIYLGYLGLQMLRSDGSFGVERNSPAGSTLNRSALFWQGFLVIWSNPKAFVFFGAFLPQFITPGNAVFTQTLGLGVIFMLEGGLFDSLYAFCASAAGRKLSRNRVRTLEIISGSCLLAGALWLALSRM